MGQPDHQRIQVPDQHVVGVDGVVADPLAVEELQCLEELCVGWKVTQCNLSIGH